MQRSTLSEDQPQSFVIRMWQASPREWRGTIRHVQSGVQHGFTKIEQTRSFIEQRTKVTTFPRPLVTFDWNRLSRRQMRLAGGTIGVLAFAFIALMITISNPNLPLSGAAVDLKVSLELLTAFLVGIGIGGIVVGVWFKFIRH